MRKAMIKRSAGTGGGGNNQRRSALPPEPSILPSTYTQMRGPQRSEDAVEAIIRKLKSQTWSTHQRGVSGSAFFARIADFNFRPILPRPGAHEVAEGSSAQAREANAQSSAKGIEEVGIGMDTVYGARTKKEEGKEDTFKASP